ncbi:MAG: hypothetical protein A49_14780 [Methyloceanibacter sp.]|nr:MAG: hypothetical protein A49_14780 [Methyloceanibacter sp.]
MKAFEGATNGGELLLIYSILRAIRTLATNRGREVPSDSELATILESVAQPASKKKIVVLKAARTPMLDKRGLPRARKRSARESNKLLDELGEYLRNAANFPTGPVEGLERPKCLKAAVGFCYEQLNRLVDTLPSDELLEWLVLHHESILQESTESKLMLATRLACYESAESLSARWLKEDNELSQAALGLRFLIEVAVSRAPRGNGRMSRSTLDRLLALAIDTVDIGRQCDIIQFGLGEAQMAILPSGRLGRDFSNFADKWNAFFSGYAASQLDQSVAGFAGRWAGRNDTEAHGDLGSAIEIATREEFGIPLSRIAALFRATSMVALQTAPGCCRLPVEEWVERLRGVLGWPADEVRQRLRQFSLESRADFLSPPAPFVRNDVYPWNYTREYSYLRRPFLLARRECDLDVIIGPRHMHRAWSYLLHLIMSGSLRARSSTMKALIGQSNHKRGESFNDDVADRLEEIGHVKVRRRVKKITPAGAKLNLAQIGDIDILCACRHLRRLAVIECKAFAMARTPAELAHELDEVFGDGSDKPSAVMRLMRRADWVRQHLPQTLEWLGLASTDRWQVVPYLVFDALPVSAYFQKAPLPVLTPDELVTVFAK